MRVSLLASRTRCTRFVVIGRFRILLATAVSFTVLLSMLLCLRPKLQPKKNEESQYPGLDYDVKEEDTERQRKPKIVILTLIRDCEKQLPVFRALLQHFSYPHHLLSVVLGEEGSTDNTAEVAKQMLHSLEGEFRRTEFVQLPTAVDGGFKVAAHAHSKHDYGVQLERRAHLARVRNKVLEKGLKDEDWVFWLDSDVLKAPKDLIESLLGSNKTIIVPQCLIKLKPAPAALYTAYDVYDGNTWRESKKSLEFQRREKPKYLFLEFYRQKRPSRYHLAALEAEGDLVEVDAVGACALLIKADHHRKGLIFPERIYKNQIESEGLGRMAQDMNISLWAMPRLAVLHTCNYESAHGSCADPPLDIGL